MVEKISAVDLKQKLDSGKPLQLVAAIDEFAFKPSHIPGSLFFASPKDAVSRLDKKMETIIYCSGPGCITGPFACQYFMQKGFEKVVLFSGGLEVWTDAGFPIEKERGF